MTPIDDARRRAARGGGISRLREKYGRLDVRGRRR
jgi:hypothetical protein